MRRVISLGSPSACPRRHVARMYAATLEADGRSRLVADFWKCPSMAGVGHSCLSGLWLSLFSVGSSPSAFVVRSKISSHGQRLATPLVEITQFIEVYPVPRATI